MGVLIAGSLPLVVEMAFDSLFEFLARLRRACEQVHRAPCNRARCKPPHPAVARPVVKVDNRKSIATQDRVTTPCLETERGGSGRGGLRQRSNAGFGDLFRLGMRAEIVAAANPVKFYDPAKDFLLEIGGANPAPRKIPENRFDLGAIGCVLDVFGGERMEIATLDEHARRQVDAGEFAEIEPLVGLNQCTHRTRYAGAFETGGEQIAVAVA